jgi:hypothetical protein
MPSWLNVTEIVLLLFTCWACYNAGKMKGVADIIELLLHKRMITMDDVRKLEKE